MKIEILQTNSLVDFPILANIIKFFQNTLYSHYVIRVTVEGMTYYYDSTGAGVRKSSASYFNSKHSVYKSFEVKKQISFIDFESFFNIYDGRKYGKIQLVGLLLKAFNIVRHNPFGMGAKRIICNELVILFLNHFGYTNIIDTDCFDLKDTDKLLRGLTL